MKERYEEMNAVAILNMNCKFPGADNIKEYWKNIKNGVESISFFDESEVKKSNSAFFNSNLSYVNAGGILKDIDQFDAKIFGYSNMEAEIMDPQIRLFLECAWEGIEKTGYLSNEYDGKIGVFASSGQSTYYSNNLIKNKEVVEMAGIDQLQFFNNPDFLPTQLSYRLNLSGPSININTACSSSLVAVCMACQSLLTYQSDIAIAGGVSISIPQKIGYQYQPDGIMSADGHCRPFDDNASGTVGGNGVGLIILKRLEDAIADEDEIFAIIRGYSVNNDGAKKVGYSASSVQGQKEVISDALALSEVEANEITYIECHGTGTMLGDPIEVKALSEIYGEIDERREKCALGSVKANIGHLDKASGIAGLIKAVLALHNQTIPPQINFDTLNKEINMSDSFYINTRSKYWESSKTRKAAVNSLGIGGTNAHIILEEYVQGHNLKTTDAIDDNKPYIFPYSARDEKSFKKYMSKTQKWLKDLDFVQLGNVSYTLTTGRKNFEMRDFFVAESLEQLSDAISCYEEDNFNFNNTVKKEINQKCFMFTGIGDTYQGMGYGLYQNLPIFRDYVEECFRVYEEETGENLRDILFTKALEKKQEENDNKIDLNQTKYAHIALFIFEYSYAETLIQLGIEPNCMIGYSLGEIVAATIAGVFELEDAIKFVVRRSLLIEQEKQGRMLSIFISEQKIQEYLKEGVYLAAVNCDVNCIVSGRTEDIQRLSEELMKDYVVNKILKTEYPFHSTLLSNIREKFYECFEDITLKAPKIPYVSTYTGKWINAEEVTSPDFWFNLTISCIRFDDAVKQAVTSIGNQLFIEIGPGNALCSFVSQNSAVPDDYIEQLLPVLGITDEYGAEYEKLLNALGKVWTFGNDIRWEKLYSAKEHFVHLPTYAFNQKRYWIESEDSKEQTLSIPEDNNEGFYSLTWKEVIGHNILSYDGEEKNCLIFIDKSDDISLLEKRLDERNIHVVKVISDMCYQMTSNTNYSIRYNVPDDYASLFYSLEEQGKYPNIILFGWQLNLLDNRNSFEQIQEMGFLAAVHLMKAIHKCNRKDKIKLIFFTKEIWNVTGCEDMNPSQSTILGLCNTLHQELSYLYGYNIDIDKPLFRLMTELEIDLLYNQIFSDNTFYCVALREQRIWVREFIYHDKFSNKAEENLLRENGVYLITGGLGKDSFTRCKYLTKKYKAKLVLFNRTSLPPEDKWKEYLENKCADSNVLEKIERVDALKQMGADMLIVQGNICNNEDVERCIALTHNKYGNINGIIHSAGITDKYASKMIVEMEDEDIQKHYDPKIKGTNVLYSIFHKYPLDFIILNSSIAALTGGVGLAAYSAASMYMDSFVNMKWVNGESNWKTFDWEGTTDDKTTSFFADMMQNKYFPQIIFSKGNPSGRIEERVFYEQAESKEVRVYERTETRADYIQPENEIEEIIADIWGGVLRISKIGINDNFYELGGNSLIALNIVLRINDTFNSKLSLRDFLANKTVKELSELIINQQMEEDSAAEYNC